MNLKESLNDFGKYLILEGLAEDTFKGYVNKMTVLSKKYDIQNLSNEIIKDLVIDLKSNLSQGTVNNYVKALLRWKDYTKQEYDLPKIKTIEQGIPDYFNEDYFLNEIVPAIEFLFQEPVKVKSIAYLLYYTGLRVSEVANLKKKDVDLLKQRINIQKRKAKNPIVVYYPKAMNDLLEVYFDMTPDSEKVFNITSSGIRSYCKKLSENLDKKMTPHMFRHSFAIMFLKNGGDISVLKELLGHKSINSTLIYAKMTNEDIEAEYRKIIKIKRRR